MSCVYKYKGKDYTKDEFYFLVRTTMVQPRTVPKYNKILFPKGDTAAKIQGHETLEEFKKQKEARIKELEKELEQLEPEFHGNIIQDNNFEIETLKQELADVESGRTQLKAVAKFYESTIFNVLKKQGYNPVEITDEYGNKWNEITLDKKRDLQSIRLKSSAKYDNPLLRLEEKMAEVFEDYKNSLFTDPKFPELAAFIDSLYNFIYRVVDILQQYISDRMTMETLMRRLENNTLGRDFMGNRRQSYKDLFQRNVESLEGPAFKISNGTEEWTTDRLRRRLNVVTKYILPQYLKGRTLSEFLKENDLAEVFEDIAKSLEETDPTDPDTAVMAEGLRNPNSAFGKYLLRDLQETHGIKVIQETNEDSTPTQDWQVNYREVSARDKMGEKLRAYLAMIPQLNKGYTKETMFEEGAFVGDDYGIPIYESPSKMFNKLMSVISDSVSYDDMIAKLLKASTDNYWLHPDALKGFENTLYRLAQYVHAHRAIVNVDQTGKTEDGTPIFEYKYYDANVNSIKNVLFKEFEQNFENAPKEEMPKLLAVLRDTKKPMTMAGYKALLDNLGFIRPREELEKITNKNNLRANLIAVYAKENPFAPKNLGARKAVMAIAEAITDANAEIAQQTIRTVANRTEYMIIPSNFIWKTFNALKKGVFNTEVTKNSVFHRKASVYTLLNKNQGIQLFLLDGRQDTKTQYADFSEIDYDVFSYGAFWGSFKKQEVGDAFGLAAMDVPPMADSPSHYSAIVPVFDIRSRGFRNKIWNVYEQETDRIENGGFISLAWGESGVEIDQNDLDTGIQYYDQNRKKRYFFREVPEELAKEEKINMLLNQIEEEYQKYKALVPHLGEAEHLRLYFYNQYFWNTQFITLLAGDPAFYKNNEALQKRIKQSHAPGEFGRTEQGETFTMAYAKDIKLPSLMDFSFNPELKKIYTDPEDGNDITDAGAFHTLDRRKRIEEQQDTWTPEKEKAYQVLKKWERDNKDALRAASSPVSDQQEEQEKTEIINDALAEAEKVFLEPLKPHIFYMREEDGILVPTQVKYSSVTLTPLLAASSPGLQNIYEEMNQKKIDEVVYGSAVKVGLQKEGGPGELIPQQVPAEHFKIQQDVPSHFFESTNSMGTQMRKLSMANLIGTYNVAGKKMSAAEVKKEFESLIQQTLLDNRKRYTLTKKSITELSNYLIENANAREIDLDLEDALSIENGEFKIPLWIPYHAAQTESLINSAYKKMKKVFTAGGSFVNIPSVGHEDLRIRQREDGSIEAVEVGITAYNQEMLDLFEDGQTEINVDNLPANIQRLFKGVVYRIPTEHKYSMFPYEVKKIFHPSSGGIIAMPREVTKIAGLDFDIDKVFSMTYENVLSRKDWKELKRKKQEERQNKLLTNETLDEADLQIEELEYNSYKRRVQRNNRMVELIRSVLTSPQHLNEQLTPGGFEEIKDIVQEIRDLQGETGSTSPLASPVLMREFTMRNLIGNRLIGIIANHNAHQATIQDSDLKLASPIVFDGEKESFVPKTEDGFIDTIRTMATFLAAAVDNAKDPILGDMNMTTTLAPVVMMLARLGVPLRSIIYFMSQPKVRDISRLLAKDPEADPVSVMSTMVPKGYKGAYPMSIKALEQNLKEPTAEMDAQIASTLLDYFQKATDLNVLTTASKIDTDNGPRIADVDKTLANIEYARRSEYLMNIEDLLPSIVQTESGKFFRNGTSTPVMDAYADMLIEEINFFRDHYPYFNPKYMTVKNMFNNNFGRPISAGNVNYINTEIINYVATSFYYVDNKKQFMVDFRKKLREFKATDKSERWRELLNSLTEEKKNGYIIVRPKTVGGFSKADIRMLRGQMQELMTAHPELEIDKYAFHTRGMNFGPKSLFHLMPVEYIAGELKTYLKDNVDNFDPGMVFDDIVLNHYQRKGLLPELPSLAPNSDTITMSPFEFRTTSWAVSKASDGIALMARVSNNAFKRVRGKGIPNTVTEYQTDTFAELNRGPFRARENDKLDNQECIMP